MATDSRLSTAQLKEALAISEQIEKLQARLDSILGRVPAATAKPAQEVSRKRKMSPAARKRIADAQRKRWAKKKGKQTGSAAPAKATASAASKPSRKKKRGLTPEGRAKLSAAMKRRWAQSKKKGAPPPTTSKK